MRSIQGGERGTYSRARTSYVEDRKGKVRSLLDNRPSAGTRPLFHLGATQGYGIIQQLRVRFRQYLDVRQEDEVRRSDLILSSPFHLPPQVEHKRQECDCCHHNAIRDLDS